MADVYRVSLPRMGSSKKHKEKDREHRHKHQKHRSHDRSRSRSRGRHHGDSDRSKEKHDDRKRLRDEGDNLYDEEQDLREPPVVDDDYEQYAALAAPPSPTHTKQELTNEGYRLSVTISVVSVCLNRSVDTTPVSAAMIIINF